MGALTTPPESAHESNSAIAMVDMTAKWAVHHPFQHRFGR